MRLVIAFVAWVVVSPIAVAAEPIEHVPPASAEAGKVLELVVEASAAAPTLRVHYRAVGTRQFTALELVRRGDAQWVAAVPASAVAAPGLEYYLDAGGDTVFATAEWPHAVSIQVAPDDARKTRDMIRSASRRSRITTTAEWVDYGTRRVLGEELIDRYYRIDADFAYRLWAYPLEEIRIGYTRLLGDTAAEMCTGPVVPCTADAGFKVAGWFELGLAPLEGVRVDTRAIVLATQSGFAIGARGELRLGVRDASHIAAGAEYLADVGATGFFRLGWGTVPRTPMAATVEVTNLPDRARPTGVRLIYDIARALGDNLKIGARIGYVARTQSVAGITGGVTASVDF
ncbi:MAG: hypothetical protein AB7P03_18820 [Kofleriaceae bacterium]